MPPEEFGAFIWHYAKPFRWLFISIIISSAALALLEVYLFESVGSLVDWMSATERDSFLETYGGRLIAIGVLIVVIWPLLALLDELVLLQGIMGNMPMQMRWRGHRYLLRQSAGFFADEFAGRLATKLMQTSLAVRETIVNITNLLVYMTIYFTAALYLFLKADWRLTLPLGFWIIAYVTAMWLFLPRLQKVSEAQADARSELTGRVVDAYANIQTVKMFSSGEAEDAYARDGMKKMLGTVYPQMRLSTQLSIALHLINSLLIASAAGLGIILWTQGAVTLGAVAIAGALSLRIQGFSHEFLWEIAVLFENIGVVDDGRKTLSRQVAVRDDGDAAFSVTEGAVSIENAAFEYGEGKPVIRDLSLDLDGGEKVGLVGRSGAGKSTLINLLLRFYDLDEGKILIDGQNIVDVRQDDLRAQIAVVSQDTSLLHRSIRDNVAYGRPSATEGEIVAALKDAEAWDFVDDLKDTNGNRGLDAMVGERGVKLSGGQRQRIAIARVMLKNAPILILDEATSALDSEAEAAIQSKLAQIMAGKTVIAIAHRLSTIAAMNKLYVVDNGRIVESGDHDSLVANGGIYADLWARQSGGFITPQKKPKSQTDEATMESDEARSRDPQPRH